MLAVYMARLYGMRVHVLENNEGLLERDYRQNKPFFARFGLKCSMDLADAEAQIFYCLKARASAAATPLPRPPHTYLLAAAASSHENCTEHGPASYCVSHARRSRSRVRHGLRSRPRRRSISAS